MWAVQSSLFGPGMVRDEGRGGEGYEREGQRAEAGELACMTFTQQDEGIITAMRWASHAKPIMGSHG